MQDGKTVYDIISTIQTQLVAPFLNLLTVLATLLFLYGIVEFIIGSDNETARTKGKKHMIWGVVGLVIILSADAIIAVLKNFFNA